MRKFLLFIFLLSPVSAYGNVVWPALYLETRLFSWWAISVGLIVEYLFVRKVLSAAPFKAVIATSSANVVSASLGILLVPLAGLAWELFPASIYNYLLGYGTFNPITWAGTFLVACAVNVAFEGLVYKKVFKLPFQYRTRVFWWFMLANSVSVGVAIASIWVVPIQA
ncbi:hypothetical protein R50072_34480 [Simiduia litorea]|uniref:hypothetical protein n=1 Tax=Simiduia litorea TaxID=1435348 RepID=UPI0036F21202